MKDGDDGVEARHAGTCEDTVQLLLTICIGSIHGDAVVGLQRGHKTLSTL